VATFDYRSTALGYLNPERLLDRVFATKGLAPAFLDHLGWPARLPKERPGQVEALEKQLTHLTATDDRFRGVAIEHVLVVELYEFLKDREAQLAAMFLSTRDEKGLRAPFRARYLDRNKECMALHDEVAIGKSRVDVLGVIRKTILGFSAGEVYAAYELKARYAEVKRARAALRLPGGLRGDVPRGDAAPRDRVRAAVGAAARRPARPALSGEQTEGARRRALPALLRERRAHAGMRVRERRQDGAVVGGGPRRAGRDAAAEVTPCTPSGSSPSPSCAAAAPTTRRWTRGS
jgi:hypothetical protein